MGPERRRYKYRRNHSEVLLKIDFLKKITKSFVFTKVAGKRSQGF